MLQANQVLVNGRIWTIVDGINEEIAPDASTAVTSFRWDAVSDGVFSNVNHRTPWMYFLLFFPMHVYNTAVGFTNVNLDRDGHRTGGHTNIGEIVKLLGLRLAMVRDPLPGNNCADYWNTVRREGSVKFPRNYFLHYGMSRNRFDTLMRNFAFCGDTTFQVRQVLCPCFMRSDVVK